MGWKWSVPDSCCHLESPGCGAGLFIFALSNCLVFTVLRTGGTTLLGRTGLYLTPAATWSPQVVGEASTSLLCQMSCIYCTQDWRNYPVGRNWSVPDSCCHLESPGCGVGLFLSALSNCFVFTGLRTGGTTLWAVTGLYPIPAATWSPQGVGQASSSPLCLTVLYSLYSGLAELPCGPERVCTRLLLSPGVSRVWGGPLLLRSV